MRKILLLIIIVLITAGISFSQKSENNSEKTFIYVIKLTPKYYDEKNWKDDDNKAVSDHFIRFQNMLKEGSLVLAGRTDAKLNNTFGIAIYYAALFEEAKIIAEEDPDVKVSVMTAEVFPFNIELIQGGKSE